jgi:hypothetical protein
VFVYIFSVFTTKIFFFFFPHVLDEGVCVRGASHENSFCELVYIVANWDYLQMIV